MVSISTEKPLPAGLDKFYFEVQVKPIYEPWTLDAWPDISIGLCTMGGKAFRFPGLPARATLPSGKSWAYHGRHGGLYCSEPGIYVAQDLPYRIGHTVGCGVDLTTGTIWFTRDGKKIDSRFENVKGRLFPFLGLYDAVLLETNFAGPFLWKGHEPGEG